MGAQEERRLQPKCIDVLMCLAARPGQVVTRDEILHAVWGERAVTDEPLTRCVGDLRKALGDSRDAPRYVQTIPKRGYRLIESITPLAAPEPVSASVIEPEPEPESAPVTRSRARQHQQPVGSRRRTECAVATGGAAPARRFTGRRGRVADGDCDPAAVGQRQ